MGVTNRDHADDVEQHHVEPEVPVGVRNGQKISFRRMARVVHHRIDPAVTLGRQRDEPFEIGRICHRSLQRHPAEFVCEHHDPLRARHECERVSACMKFARDGFTHTLTGGGDECDGFHAICSNIMAANAASAARTVVI